MSKGLKIGCIVAVILAVLILIPVFTLWGTYNTLVSLEEDVNQTWSQVQNVYQRRYDLIPNLVETVKGYAEHERETFQAVTEARAQVGGVMKLNAGDLTPENLEKFQEAQAGLGGALRRLLVLRENYPELKANQNFLRLQDELAGTENRITVERRRFNQAVQTYNTTIRRFPQNIIAGLFGFEKKPYFEADEGAQEAPKVEF
ncbi:MAG: LemA family protein [bacterium]